MKKLTLHLICLFSFLLVISCNKEDKTVGTPKIQAGTAKITGKVMSPKEKIDNNSFVEFFVPHPITGDTVKYRAAIDPSGKFSTEIDVETDVTLVAIHTSLKPHNSIYVKVRTENVTDLDIIYGQNMEIEDVQTKPKMSKDDMIESVKVVVKMLGIYDDSVEPTVSLYDKSPEAYPAHVKKMVAEKLKILYADSLVSTEIKDILARDYKIWRYSLGLFEYGKSMKFNYWQINKDTVAMPKFQSVDRSYFSFLKDLDLNNPKYLLVVNFSTFQIAMLKNETLLLTEIADQDIAAWLATAKATLSDLVGFEEGQYYEVLAANAYGRQLVYEKRPLTDQQQKNIAAYWKDGEIAKILLRKNEQLGKK